MSRPAPIGVHPPKTRTGHNHPKTRTSQKKPRKGSIAFEIARIAPLAQPIMYLCDVAAQSGASIQEVVMLVRSGYKGAVRRKALLEKCYAEGHDGIHGKRCERCGDVIERGEKIREVT